MIVRKVQHEGPGERYMFFCPGCRCGHWFHVQGGFGWSWNGNFDKPTVQPSILTWHDGQPPYRCHSYVTDGMIRFLADCTHELKNQTVPLEEF